MARKKQWTQTIRAPGPVKPDEAEKRAIVTACDAFIREILIPRFLPAIRPTEWNYPVGIHGVWAGGRYRFIQRYRSGQPDSPGEEFDAPFARIDRVGPDRFDIYWMRHTGKWWPVYAGVSLAKALRLLQDDELLHPL